MIDLRQSHWQVLLAGIILTGMMIGLCLWRPLLLQGADNYILDFMLQRVPVPDSAPEPVIIVDVDEATLREFGQWPWPRDQLAMLLQEIAQANPAAIGLDILFSEPDRLGADKELRETLAQAHFTLGIKFYFSHPSGPAEPIPTRGALPLALLQEFRSGLFQATDVTVSLPQLTEAAGGVGFLNATTDWDGVLRRVPLMIGYGDEVYPSLALAVFLLSHPNQPLALRRGTLGLDSLQIGTTRIPIDLQGQLRIHYPVAQSALRWFSAADLLHHKIPLSSLRGRNVLVGTTAAGLDSRLATPMGYSVPGIEVHGLVLSNLLQGRFLSRPAAWRGFEIMGMILLGGLVCLIFTRLPLLVGLGLTAALAGGIWEGSYLLLQRDGVVYSPVPPLLLLALLVPVVILVHFLAEQKNARHHRQQTVQMQNFMMHSLTSLANIRDSETGGHIRRTQFYLRILCEHLAKQPKFSPLLSPTTIDQLVELAPLHDIGKVGVPDRLLRKPGRLDPDEYEEIKLHTLYGRQAIDDAERQVDVVPPDDTLKLAKDIVYCHHEWWDGSGYPEGLRGEAIPLAGRLMAIADVYDALVSRRVYKGPVSHQAATKIILAAAGSQFDPDLVAAFHECESRWRQISQQYSTSEIQ